MRYCIFRACLLLILACAYCPAQKDQSGHFEAASIEPAAALEVFSGGPGTGRATFEGTTTLETLINMAYDLGLGRLAGPSWISSEWYAVSARYPSGTTGEQFRQMLANLLAERVGLVIHQVTKEVIGYELIVASGGPKLTPARFSQSTVSARGMSWDSRKDGNTTHMIFRQTTMALLEYQVSSMLSGSGPDQTVPVIDRTGLSDHFDFDLEIPTHGEARADPYGISSALEKQLGLKLNPMKASLSYLVIDDVKKAPIGN